MCNYTCKPITRDEEAGGVKAVHIHLVRQKSKSSGNGGRVVKCLLGDIEVEDNELCL
jgi:hypothetical protein